MSETDITLHEHLQRIGKSRSEKKLAALAQNRLKAAQANRDRFARLREMKREIKEADRENTH